MRLRLPPLALAGLAAAPLAVGAAPRVIHRVQPSLRTAAGSGPSCAATPSTCKLDYYGGHVIPNVKVYEVQWTAAVTTSLSDFLAQVTNSPYLDWLNEYSTNLAPTAGTGTAGTNQLVGRGVFAGTIAITPVVNTGTTVDDADIVDELKSQIAAGALPPPDQNALYATFFPPGYAVTAGSASSCTAGGFCGYHGTFTLDGKTGYYAVLPSHDAGTGCDVGCGSLTQTTSHELVESITDAEAGLATAAGPPLAWYDDTNGAGEIADLCDGADNGTTFLGSTGYRIEPVFSNRVAASCPTCVAQACVASRTAASDFSVEFNAGTPPASVSLTAGGADLVVPVFAKATTSDTQTLTLGLAGVPADVTALLAPTLGAVDPVMGNTTNLTLHTTSATHDARDLVIALEATNGAGETHTAGLLVQITGGVAASDFGIAVSPVTQSVDMGSSAVYTITTTAIGAPDSLTLAVSGLPARALNPVFTPATITAGGSSTLTLATDPAATSTPPADFAITATGSAAVHSTVARLGFPDYRIDVAPAVAGVSPGGTQAFTVNAITLSGSPTGIALGVSGLPPGVTGSFNPSTVSGGASSTLTLTAAGSAPNAPAAPFTVTGTDVNSTVRTGTAQISVGNDFSVWLSPAAVTVTRGQSSAVTVSTGLVYGTAETIALAASGLPAGVTAAFSPASVSTGQASTLTLTASPTAPLAAGATVTVTGTSASATHAAAATVGVADPPPPPTVSVIAPADGATVSGAVEIDARASAGGNGSLLKIDVLVDGAVLASLGHSPAQALWQSTEVPDGAHAIAARAVDTDGTSATSATVHVTVRNGHGGCSSGGAGAAALLGLLVIALRRRGDRARRA